MKTKSLLLATFIFTIYSLTFSRVNGQGKAPLWTKEMKSPVAWQKVTSFGQLVACTSEGLIGIDTKTGNQLWMLTELKNSPESSYESITNTPFISLSSAANKNSVYIADPLEGKILFSSVAAGLEQVSDKFFLYQNSMILVIGTSQGGKATELVMVDMTTGKKLWSKSGAFSFTTAAKDLGNDEVLITSAFFASKLKASTGDEIWKSPIDPKSAGFQNLLGSLEGFASRKLDKEEIMAQLITPSMKPDMFIIAAQKKNESTKTDSKGNKTVSITYSSVYMGFDIATGKHRWPSVVELKNPLGISYPVEQGLLVGSSQSGNLNMLNYQDGSRMLGKKGGGINLKGPAAGMAPLKEGKLLVVSDNGNNSSITMLDPATGMLVFEKAVKIKGKVSYTEILDKAVLVGTESEVNLLNTSAGEWLMEDGFDGGAGLIASNDKSVYVFNTKEGILYHMPVTGTSFNKVNSTPVEFQGKEKPTAVEITENGILLTSNQNIALIGDNGSVKFNKYFQAPTVSDFRKALLIASAVRAAYYTAAFATYSAAFGAASQSIQVKDPQSKMAKDITGDVSQLFGNASVTGAKYTMSYIKMAQQRFSATTQGSDYMLIMTAESRKDVRLLQVSKSTGEVLNTILIGKDKDPVYDVDLVEGKLYYMKDARTMECYQF